MRHIAKYKSLIYCLLTLLLGHLLLRILVLVHVSQLKESIYTVLTQFPQYCLVDFAICAIIFLCLIAIMNSIYVGCVSFMVVMVAFGLLQRFVEGCRGTLFLYPDIFSVTTAVTVAQTYKFHFDIIVILALIITGLWICLLTLYARSGWVSKNHQILIRLTGVAGFGVFLSICLCTNILSRIGIPFYEYNPAYPMTYFGVESTFFRSFMTVDKLKPNNYSVSKTEKLIEKILKEDDDKTILSNKNQPDVVLCVMDESFTDFSVYDKVNLNGEDILPYYYSLKNSDDNVVTGQMLMSVYGGGTANSEYEFLTGNSVYNSITRAVYMYGIKNDIPTLARIFANYGYKALYSHPYDARNWDRELVYPYLGFEKFDSIESGVFDNCETYRDLVTDKADFDYLMNIVDNAPDNEKLFLFNVTIQNHGAYTYFDDHEYTEKIFYNPLQQNLTDDTMRRTNEFLSCMHKTDIALKGLIDKCKKSDKKILLCVFGDHQGCPDANMTNWLNSYEAKDISYKEYLYGLMDTYKDSDVNYKTPYLLWTNYDCDLPHKDVVSSTRLGSMVLEAAGYQLPKYYDYIRQADKWCLAFNASGYIDLNQVYHLWSDCDNEELQAWFDNYKCLNYYLLHDVKEKYADFFR